MPSPQADAAILRRVASTAVEDARKAWKKARDNPDEKRTRSAYRACVFASRALRRAAAALPKESRQMLEEARRLDTAGKELLSKLVHIVEA